MSFTTSSSKTSAKLGEDQSNDNLPKSSSNIVYIKISLSRLELQFVQILIVRSAINEAVKEILDADASGIYDDVAKSSINDYLEMCIQGMNHLRGMYYEIRSQAKPLRISVAKTLVTRAIGNSVTIFHFDFTKAVSHSDDREIFEMYRGTFKDDGDSSLSTPRCTFGGSPSVLSDVESVMITDEDDPKGTHVLSSLERKLDSALKVTTI